MSKAITISGSEPDENQRLLNPAASRSRMAIALAGLVVLGLLSWFTIDGAAVIHVHGFTTSVISIEARDVPVRWFPILFLSLFAFRTVLANMRARLEERDSQKS